MRTKPQTDIVVSRENIEQCLFDLFSHTSSSLYSTLPYVQFEGENATDLDGLSRELFSLFWEVIRSQYFEGCTEAVPRVDPQTCGREYHGYNPIIWLPNNRFFPVFICKVSVMAALDGIQMITDNLLLT